MVFHKVSSNKEFNIHNIISQYYFISYILQEEDALLVLVVHLANQGAAVLVHPVGPEAVLVVAEAVIPTGADAADFRESGSQNLACSERFEDN